jgi:ABC-2 type transport system permease protein
MRGAFASEFYKLRRPGILLGCFGLIVGMSLLIATILFLTAKPQAQLVADALANAGQPSRTGLSFETLEKPDGYATAFQFAGQIIGVVALVVFAQNFGAEYGQGTLKMLLAREPRRIRILGAKLAALAVLVVAAVLAAFVLQTALVAGLAHIKGLDTSQWWTAQSALDGTLLVLRVAGAALAWGSMGTFLAVLLRAAPPAIGIGIGYTLLVEGILAFALKGATKWLPGQALTSFVAWGTPRTPGEALLPPAWASAAVALYAVAFVVAAATLLSRRDVTS